MMISVALHGLADGGGDALDVVADGGRAINVDAEVAQGQRDVPRVGVDDFAEQNLGADGDDLCGWHIPGVFDVATMTPDPVRSVRHGRWHPTR